MSGNSYAEIQFCFLCAKHLRGLSAPALAAWALLPSRSLPFFSFLVFFLSCVSIFTFLPQCHGAAVKSEGFINTSIFWLAVKPHLSWRLALGKMCKIWLCRYSTCCTSAVSLNFISKKYPLPNLLFRCCTVPMHLQITNTKQSCTQEQPNLKQILFAGLISLQIQGTKFICIFRELYPRCPLALWGYLSCPDTRMATRSQTASASSM